MAGRTSRRPGAPARLILLAIGAAVVPPGGCAPKDPAGTKGSPPPRVTTSTGPGARPTQARDGAPTSPTAAQDDCAARLHDISGLLLLYFVTNRNLPERLEDLAPLSDSPSTFQTTCPVSGRPYVYTRQGLPGAGSDRVLLVHDPEPSHGGLRWVIVASPPQGDQPLSTWVMPYTDQRFRRHAP